MRLTLRVTAGLAVTASLVSQPSVAALVPLESRLDQFVVYRNGAVLFNDRFDDGVPPPTSGGGISYFSVGGYAETAGKVVMESEHRGRPLFFDLINAQTGRTIISSSQLTRIHETRVQTNISQLPTSTQGLKRDHHTFQVLGLYDLVVPPPSPANYGVGLIDNFAGSGPTDDRLRLSVIGSATRGPEVMFWRNDQRTTPDQNFVFGRAPLDTNPANSQIVLSLSRDSTASNVIAASYAYVNAASAGLDLSNPANLAALTFNAINNTTRQPATIFNDFLHTRAEFRQLALDVDNRFDFARLKTGSPVSISQSVSTGPTPSYLTFNYRFETTTGELRVMLGSTQLGVLASPNVVINDFTTAHFLIDYPLLDQNLLLSFIMDGPTGSSILLDSIFFEGLQNGNFVTGDLTGWQVAATGAGSAGVLTILASQPAAVAEPATAALVALSLTGLMAIRRGRRLS